MTNGLEEESRRFQEMALSQEQMERRAAEAATTEKGEALFTYPLEGKDLIEEIQKVEVENLPQVAEEALAFMEGLPFGIEDYDLNNPETLLDLQNRFTSVEGAMERPSPWYLGTAIKERVRKEVRSIKGRLRRDQSLGDREKRQLREQLAELMRIENQREGRKTIDAAFIQRMLACEAWEAVANLLSKDPNYRPSVTPDKGHWQGALWGEFGERVDRVFRRIAAAGVEANELGRLKERVTNILKERRRKGRLSQQEMEEQIRRLNEDLRPVPRLKAEDAIYARGFVKKEDFKTWLSHLLKATDGRMDVVWFAWRLALLWELPIQFGSKEVNGKINLADPPIGNDLFVWTVHLEDKRALEWGLDASGKRGEKGRKFSKYLTHTGYPLSLGRIYNVRAQKEGVLCESYLHEARVYDKDEKREASFWELWWERGMKLGGHFEDEEAVKNILPWALTEAQPRGLDTAELPPGSFGFWYLTRWRAAQVLKDIRSRPDLGGGPDGLSNPDFFASRLRNWEKVLGVVDEKLPPEKNPRTWWVAGLLFAHYLGRTQDAPLMEANAELEYRTLYPGEVWSWEKPGVGERRAISVEEIFQHTRNCGFLRAVDEDWIRKQLGIKRRRV